MASTSANDIIKRAMVKATIIYPGESIPSDKLYQVLDDLNDMLESWSLEKLMVLSDVLESFSLTSGTAEYTYGAGGDFNSARPIEIKDECFVRDGDTDYECRLLTLDVYRRRRLKTTGSSPRFLAYNPEYPLIKVFFWPTPAGTGQTMHIRSSKVLESFATPTTKVDLAPGYRRAIVANLAVEISPSFGKSPSTQLLTLAKEAKKSIKSANIIPVKPMTTPDLTRMSSGRSGYSVDNLQY